MEGGELVSNKITLPPLPVLSPKSALSPKKTLKM